MPVLWVRCLGLYYLFLWPILSLRTVRPYPDLLQKQTKIKHNVHIVLELDFKLATCMANFGLTTVKRFEKKTKNKTPEH